jgi:hypothetical protein
MSQADCSYFDSLDTPFFDPVTTSVFEPGDTAPVRWYAGLVPQGTGSLALNTTFNLVLQAYRGGDFVYNVLSKRSSLLIFS